MCWIGKEDMTTAIATLALLTSIMLLFVHYRNQVERRHGEITKLRSDSLKSIAAIQQRYTSIQMHLETARIELRRIPDCEDKYNSIELIPKLISESGKLVPRIERTKNKLDGIDTTKLNKSKMLLSLQSIYGELPLMEEDATSIEQQTLLLLKHIRYVQERAEKQGLLNDDCHTYHDATK